MWRLDGCRAKSNAIRVVQARPRGRLACSECGDESDEHARGWRVYLTREDDNTELAVAFCPTCAATEFDQDLDEF